MAKYECLLLAVLWDKYVTLCFILSSFHRRRCRRHHHHHHHQRQQQHLVMEQYGTLHSFHHLDERKLKFANTILNIFRPIWNDRHFAEYISLGYVVLILQEKFKLGPGDVIWRLISWSTPVQTMACCKTAPSHYLNQCWLIISKVLWHSSEDIIIRRCEDTKQ